MRMKFIPNKNRNSCFLACIKSFSESIGIVCNQEDIIKRHADLCQVVKDKPGVIPLGQEKELCRREGLSLDDENVITLKNMSEI